MKVLAEKKTKRGKYYDFYFLVAVIFLYFLLFSSPLKPSFSVFLTSRHSLNHHQCGNSCYGYKDGEKETQRVSNNCESFA